MSGPTGSRRAALAGRDADTAPYACSVLAGRFVDDVGEWEFAVVNTPLTKPFTHWWPLPDLAAALAPPAPPTEATEARETVLRALWAELDRQCSIGAGSWETDGETGLMIVRADIDPHGMASALTSAFATTETPPSQDWLRGSDLEPAIQRLQDAVRHYEFNTREYQIKLPRSGFAGRDHWAPWFAVGHLRAILAALPCQERPMTPEEAREVGRIEGLEEAAERFVAALRSAQHTLDLIARPSSTTRGLKQLAREEGARVETAIRSLANGEPA